MKEHSNNSPWLHQLKRTRPLNALEQDIYADIAVVGGGIAGLATAYFLLRDTNKSVVLLEADRVAHAATGHNAGQVVAYFERPFASIVKEFGLKMAADGQQAVSSAWQLIDQIYEEAGIETPMTKFAGHAGCTTLKQVLPHLENNYLRSQAGLIPEVVLVADDAPHMTEIPQHYRSLYTVIPRAQILDLLETNDKRFVAVLSTTKGCLNSAAFTEELATHLTEKYPQRFSLFEQSPVRVLDLHETSAELETPSAVARVKKVVLCTNGFEYIQIKNNAGPNINREFHHMVRGSIGYMAAYLDPQHKTPAAVSYFPIETSDKTSDAFEADPYIYVTRRLYYVGEDSEPGLVCVGGPEQLLEDTTKYTKHHPYSSKAKQDIDTFLRGSYRHAPTGNITYAFLWHGLMGYTPNGIRRVGAEPCNPVLLYNLGCNGIGILPSIYGGKRIAQIIHGDKLPPSIFDVPQSHHGRQWKRHHKTIVSVGAVFILALAALWLAALTLRLLQ